MTHRPEISRRSFVGSTLAAGAALLTGTVGVARADPTARPTAPAPPFRLDYAPHFGMFTAHAGTGLVEQLRFMAAEGFRGLEDNLLRARPVAEQTLIGRTLATLGMRMGVFVGHRIDWSKMDLPALPGGDPARRDEFLGQIRESVDVARRANARWMTVVPGPLDPRLEMGYQTANVVDALRRAAAVLEPHGMAMVLEPLNRQVNHPGMFLTGVAQTFEICRAVDSPACKVLFDIYHQQITEGFLIGNMDLAWSEIAYFQVGDSPGRNEPTTGEINYRNVLKHIHGKGYRGVIGMEHGNARPGREGERAVIDAYRWVDDFGGPG